MDQPPVVVAVIWTYDRIEVVQTCLDAVRAQTFPPARIIVADSASPDRTAAILRASDPGLDVVELAANDGMGAAMAAAIEAARDSPFDHVWFVEDDSTPAPDALALLVDFLETHPACSVVGPRGATMRRGLWTWRTDQVEGRCDFCMLDGSLIRRAAIEAAGLPRRDFFIMQIDVDYPLRVRAAGHLAHQLPVVAHHARQLGAGAADPNWRCYYQTRNHLRMAIDHGSASLLWGFVVRTAAQCATEIRRGRRGRTRVARRAHGTIDALRGRMGRTVEPPRSAPSPG